MTRFTVSTWTTVIGTPRPPRTAIAKSTISPRLAESRKATNLRTLSPIRRPSSIAATIVAKSSSVRTMSARLPRSFGSRAAHRDSDVGAAERGRVVDAVSCDGDDLAASLVRLDEPQLVGGRHAREDGMVGRGLLECGVVHGLELRAGERRTVAEPDLIADRGRGQRVVAGQHRDPDSGRARGADRIGGRGPERILERGEAEHGQLCVTPSSSGADSGSTAPRPRARAGPGVPSRPQCLQAGALVLVEERAGEERLEGTLHRRRVASRPPRRRSVRRFRTGSNGSSSSERRPGADLASPRPRSRAASRNAPST